MKKNNPIHPGHILREDILPVTGLSIAEVANALHETEELLALVVAEQAPMRAELCLKVARLFDSSPEMWVRLQANYDLQMAMLDKKLMTALQQIVPITPIFQPLDHGPLASPLTHPPQTAT